MRLVTYIAFSDEAKAVAFERYLKSGSGRAFAKKRLGSARIDSAAHAMAKMATRQS